MDSKLRGRCRMHKYVLIPDSFKGTLSARDFCAVAREAIGRADPGAQVLSIPLADGGEGTVEAFLAACGGRRIDCPCTGPYGGTAPGFYGLLPDGTAVVELAAAAGLPLAGTDLHPADATTYGVGQLLLHAARRGARRLLLGLGGSATNDGGCGAAAALGVEFYDSRGRTFVPTGGTLGDIHRISAENLEPLPPVTVLCDVDNPLCGPRGAAAVFGPQKGADPDMVRLLDAGLAHLAAVLRRDTGRDVLDMPGGGAAGGFGRSERPAAAGGGDAAGRGGFSPSGGGRGPDHNRRGQAGQPEPGRQGCHRRGPPGPGAGSSLRGPGRGGGRLRPAPSL